METQSVESKQKESSPLLFWLLVVDIIVVVVVVGSESDWVSIWPSISLIFCLVSLACLLCPILLLSKVSIGKHEVSVNVLGSPTFERTEPDRSDWRFFLSVLGQAVGVICWVAGVVSSIICFAR